MAEMFFELVIVLMCLAVLAFFVILVYKKRHVIKRFASDPNYGTKWEPDRKTILDRRIEDAEAEKAWIEEQEQKGGD